MWKTRLGTSDMVYRKSVLQYCSILYCHMWEIQYIYKNFAIPCLKSTGALSTKTVRNTCYCYLTISYHWKRCASLWNLKLFLRRLLINNYCKVSATISCLLQSLPQWVFALEQRASWLNFKGLQPSIQSHTVCEGLVPWETTYPVTTWQYLIFMLLLTSPSAFRHTGWCSHTNSHSGAFRPVIFFNLDGQFFIP